jgi:predicted transposase YdaD
VVLLVLAPDPTVARWARTPIALGHPGFCLEPLVIELADVPRIVDAPRALKLPELAVLSTLAHPELEVAAAAIRAISDLPEDRAKLYLDVILAALSASVRKQLEDRMKGYVYQSEFARKYYFQGHDEGLEKGREQGLEKGREQGLEKGREQGLEKGREEGRESGLRAAVRELLQVKVGEVTPEDESAIAGLHDDHALVELIGALGRAMSAADARMVLAACTRR